MKTTSFVVGARTTPDVTVGADDVEHVTPESAGASELATRIANRVLSLDGLSWIGADDIPSDFVAAIARMIDGELKAADIHSEPNPPESALDRSAARTAREMEGMPESVNQALLATLREITEALEGADCTFGMCPGPDVPFVEMATCSVCQGIQAARAMIAQATTQEAGEPEATPPEPVNQVLLAALRETLEAYIGERITRHPDLYTGPTVAREAVNTLPGVIRARAAIAQAEGAENHSPIHNCTTQHGEGVSP